MYNLKKTKINQNFPIEINAAKHKINLELKGKSEQATRSGKNKFNYASASDINNTYATQYRIFEIDNLKPNTAYNINNMGFTENLNNQYCYLWDTDTYSGSNKYLLAYVNQYNTKANFVSNSEGKIYLAIYPTDTTTWESVISYLENAQIEERKYANTI